MKVLFYVIFYLLCSALCEKNELFAFEIKDSTLTPSQAVSLNQIRAVGSNGWSRRCLESSR